MTKPADQPDAPGAERTEAAERTEGPEGAGKPATHKGGNLLLVGIIAGVVLGGVAGGLSPTFGLQVSFLGKLFLHALMVMVVPLVVASMIMGIASLGDVRKLGGIGLKTVVYYMATTAIAVVIGIVAVNLVKPGLGVLTGETHPQARWHIERGALVLDRGQLKKTRYDHRYRVEVQASTAASGVAAATLYGAIAKGAAVTPRRIPIARWTTAGGDDTAAPSRGEALTVAVAPKKIIGKRSTFEVIQQVVLGLVPRNLIDAMAKTQILPVIIFALVFGAVLTTLGERGQHVIRFFDGVNEAIMKMVQGLMVLAPFGIFALVAGRLGEAGGFVGFWPELRQLGKYACTVVGGLLIHATIVLPLFLVVLARRNPLRYARSMFTALTTAFSTASSAATLPVTLRGVERSGVSSRSASFVLPLGATINMDGTAMYEAVAALFIAQAYGYELGMVKQIVIFLTATLAAIGAAGIPEAGLVTMAIVLNAVSLPIEGIALILVIDWLLDRCRTTVNVWGDAVGAAVIDRLEGESITPDRG